MTDPQAHKKMQRIVKIREIGEDRAKKEYQKALNELNAFDQKLQDKKSSIETFLSERTEQILQLRRLIYTQAVKGDLFSKIEFIQEETQIKSEEMYKEIEEMSKKYYGLVDWMHEKYNGFLTAQKGKFKAQKITDVKIQEYQDFLEGQEEEALYDIPFKLKKHPEAEDD
jgi:hypothetical protein